jgi:hypothetical protein
MTKQATTPRRTKGLRRHNPAVAGHRYQIVYNSPMALYLLEKRTPDKTPEERAAMNFAFTLPALTFRGVIVYVARDYITQRHLAHEVGGHGWQRDRMGFVDYGATYSWHYLALNKGWKDHPMEHEAVSRAVETFTLFPLRLHLLEGREYITYAPRAA